jgi:hypothetical protein
MRHFCTQFLRLFKYEWHEFGRKKNVEDESSERENVEMRNIENETSLILKIIEIHFIQIYRKRRGGSRITNTC